MISLSNGEKFALIEYYFVYGAATAQAHVSVGFCIYLHLCERAYIRHCTMYLKHIGIALLSFDAKFRTYYLFALLAVDFLLLFFSTALLNETAIWLNSSRGG